MSTTNPVIKTYSPENAFSFTCPVFQATVEIRQCLLLRDLVYKGRRIEKRIGCQACMSASKCPIISLVQTMDEAGDVYYSKEPRVGHLQPELLAHIAPIVVTDVTLNSPRFADMSEEQRAAIRASNGRVVPVKAYSSKAPKLESVQAPEAVSVAATPEPEEGYAAVVNKLNEEK